MNKIKVLIACGGGIATSTFAAAEIADLAKEAGVEASITKESLQNVPALAKDYDVCFVTSKYAQDVGAPIIQVNALITGIGEDEVREEIKQALKEINEKING